MSTKDVSIYSRENEAEAPKVKTLMPDLSHAQVFFEVLAPKDREITWQVFPEKDNPKSVKKSRGDGKWNNTRTLEEATDWLRYQNEELLRGTFFMVNRGDGNKRRNENVIDIRAVFADLDGSPLDPLLNCALKPHVIVESSPGRYHGYWRVDGLSLEEFGPVQLEIARQFDGDASVKDLARVMRIPGFYHNKVEDQPFQTKLIDGTGSKTPYTRDEILTTFPIDPLEPKKKSSKAIAQVSRGSATEDHEKLSEALSYIGSNDYETWYQVGMAIKNEYGDAGLPIWKDWSSQSTKYDDSEAEYKWSTFDENGEITLGSVFYLAKKNGWTPPAKSKKKSGRANPDVVCHTDEIQLAEDFVNMHGEDFCRVKQTSNWNVWNGQRWEPDNGDTVNYAVERFMKGVSEQAKDDQRNSYRSNSKINAITSRVSRKPALKVDVSKFDADAHVFGTPSMTLDTRNLNLYEPCRNQYITKAMGIDVDGSSEVPIWNQFLAQTFEDQPEVIPFIKRLCGYILWGADPNGKIFFFHGEGRNGKGVILETLSNILGDYCKWASSTVFTRNQNEQHPTELATLNGARLVCVSEIKENKSWNEEILKLWSGGDEISARFMYGDPFQFKPQGPLVFAANQYPTFKKIDKAIKDRFILINFNQSFTSDNPKRIEDLKEKLKKEYGDILFWMLEGIEEYRKKGLQVPQCVLDDTHDMFYEQDDIQQFIDEKLIFDKDGWISADDLYNEWHDYNRIKGRQQFKGKRSFTMSVKPYLLNNGCVPKRDYSARRSGPRGYQGVSLNSGQQYSRLGNNNVLKGKFDREKVRKSMR